MLTMRFPPKATAKHVKEKNKRFQPNAFRQQQTPSPLLRKLPNVHSPSLRHILNWLMQVSQPVIRPLKIIIPNQLHIIQRIQCIQNPDLTSELVGHIVHRHQSQRVLRVLPVHTDYPLCDVDIEVMAVAGDATAWRGRDLEVPAMWPTYQFEDSVVVTIEVAVAVVCLHCAWIF